MDTNKLFKVAGTAFRNGKFKPHFANNDPEDRARVLNRVGFDAIKFVRLPRKMNKPAAIAYLLREKAEVFDDKEKAALAKKIEGTRYATLATRTPATKRSEAQGPEKAPRKARAKVAVAAKPGAQAEGKRRPGRPRKLPNEGQAQINALEQGPKTAPEAPSAND